jgi:hypothetical protein
VDAFLNDVRSRIFGEKMPFLSDGLKVMEQALEELQLCGFDKIEAMRSLEKKGLIETATQTTHMLGWSVDEVDAFEAAIIVHGHDLMAIQKEVLRLVTEPKDCSLTNSTVFIIR